MKLAAAALAAMIAAAPAMAETLPPQRIFESPDISGPRARGVKLSPDGKAVLLELVKTADVFLQNYRPGVAKRLGVDYETLSAINPRLVYCAVSGYGETGPLKDKAGFDQVLWLDGKDHEFIEEVGTMNFFVVLGKSLVTPPPA